MENVAEAFLGLSREDLSLLAAIETGMRTHEWVPTFIISKLAGLSASKSEYRLQHLFEKKLVVREAQHYLGYQINFDSYDLLALSDFVRRDQVKSIGGQIGVGKESIVLEAWGDGPLAIKFHRQGRTSFKHVRRLRDHLTDKPRVPWLYAAALAARREFAVMKKLHPQVSIPRPIAVSRHALAMEHVPGPLLNRITLEDPEDGLRLILGEVGRALGQGIIHADLSEFNIIITDSGPVIIDWPQAVDANHPHADELLKRDLGNVLRFFQRKYHIEMPLEEALSVVREADRV
ncbi:MAG: serine/threonine protein kinase [Methanothrix sp.]|uniref:RIO1 family regulatory kinase/ATPase domain-containing protein n=1 Tax=Methanothrix sp. TaxID=90426 RepID=UPI0025FD234C|nr:RIO1 family regulatory kinase/ATPase [Methanothrix sp.]MCK9406041.1 serine/threonine protein kinase [Methanothrix sp.]